jgi:isopentenyldiphosphate isomerase
MEEILDLVDENDNVIGKVTKSEMIKKRLLHRGSNIFVFNSKGEIFVHKRNKDKKIYPGYYDIVFGGTLESGDTYEEGAKRELFEESGIKNVKLDFLFKERFTNDKDDFFACVYKCIFDGEIKLQKKEIQFGRFMSIDEMENLIKKEKFCPHSIHFYEKIKWKRY